ncbi:MAG TPA: ABC transporter permease, partial [Verrucomicrobiales bacterium]|nr:ABC transporter permease [Verrucomicrobiales bacterium]
VKALLATGPPNIPRLASVSIDGVALWFTLGVSLATGLLFGLAPAWQCSRADLNEALKESQRGASDGMSLGRTQRLLVTAQVTLATVLLIGAGLMLQSFARLMSTDRGHQIEQILTADLDFSVTGFTSWVEPTSTRPQVKLRELLERVRQQPGVRSAGVAYRFLREDMQPPRQPFSIHGRPEQPDDERPTAEHNAISPGYLETLGIRLLRGRNFTEADVLLAPGVALVNESFVRRHFADEDPLGSHVTMGGSTAAPGATDARGISVWSEVVGVVSDVKSLTTRPEAVPEIYRPYWQWPMQHPTLYVRASVDAAALMPAIRQITREVVPGLPAPDVRLLADRLGESAARPRFQMQLLSLFGLLALILAAGGIYGLLAYAVTRRQREIGIRMALGAGRRNVLGLVISQGMRLVGTGIVLGIVAALALARLLRGLLFEVKPTDPLTLLTVILVLAVVALLACWLPARRASRVDPIIAVRTE